jgi:hypothetical protein
MPTGWPGANSEDSASARGVSLSNSGIAHTIVSRLKYPKLPVSWIPTISAMVASAHTTLSTPGKNAKNGAGISTKNMNSTDALSSHIGSFCAYQPAGESSGWLIRKPLR